MVNEDYASSPAARASIDNLTDDLRIAICMELAKHTNTSESEEVCDFIVALAIWTLWEIGRLSVPPGTLADDLRLFGFEHKAVEARSQMFREALSKDRADRCVAWYTHQQLPKLQGLAAKILAQVSEARFVPA